MADRKINLTIIGAEENVPRAIYGSGLDCDGAGYYTYIDLPQSGNAAMVWESKGDPRARDYKLWNSARGADGPKHPTKAVTAGRAVGKINAIQAKIPATSKPIALKGKWAGKLVCTPSGPQIVVTRKLGSYAQLALVSALNGRWEFAVKISSNQWFTTGAMVTKSGFKSLRAAYTAAAKVLVKHVGDACTVQTIFRVPASAKKKGSIARQKALKAQRTKRLTSKRKLTKVRGKVAAKKAAIKAKPKKKVVKKKAAPKKRKISAATKKKQAAKKRAVGKRVYKIKAKTVTNARKAAQAKHKRNKVINLHALTKGKIKTYGYSLGAQIKGKKLAPAKVKKAAKAKAASKKNGVYKPPKTISRLYRTNVKVKGPKYADYEGKVVEIIYGKTKKANAKVAGKSSGPILVLDIKGINKHLRVRAYGSDGKLSVRKLAKGKRTRTLDQIKELKRKKARKAAGLPPVKKAAKKKAAPKKAKAAKKAAAPKKRAAAPRKKAKKRVVKKASGGSIAQRVIADTMDRYQRPAPAFPG